MDESLYGPMFTSIANIRAVNPGVKIFANLTLKKEETYPAWVASNEDGTISSPSSTPRIVGYDGQVSFSAKMEPFPPPPVSSWNNE